MGDLKLCMFSFFPIIIGVEYLSNTRKNPPVTLANLHAFFQLRRQNVVVEASRPRIVNFVRGSHSSEAPVIWAEITSR